MKAWDSQSHFLTKTDRFFYIYASIDGLLSGSTLDGRIDARNRYFHHEGHEVHKVLIKFIHLFLCVLRDLRGIIAVLYRGKVYFGLEF